MLDEKATLVEKLRKALDAFARAAALDPDSAEIRYNLANQQLQLGLVDAAIEEIALAGDDHQANR